jgi:hypothetical protein
VFLAGDADGDHYVTKDDYRALQAAHGARVGEANYSLAADANRDGQVNAQDISLWNRSWRNSLLASAPAASAIQGVDAPRSPAVVPTAGVRESWAIAMSSSS